MEIVTFDRKIINIHTDEFYSVDRNLEIHYKIYCRHCNHFATKEAAEKYVSEARIRRLLTK